MSKKQSVAISIILLLLMASAGLTTISIPAVKAYNYEDWAYSSNLYTTNWLQYNGEAQAASTAFGQIANLFAQKTVYYYGYPYGPTYGEVQNWGSSETPSNVYGQITYDIAHHPGFSTVLYVGHGGPDGFYCHTAYPDDQNTLPDAVEFNSVSSTMQSYSSSDFQFAFMWVCMGGENSPQGSPSAWDPLWWSNPSAYPPCTWVGFDGFSQWLINPISSGNTYQNWLVFFYYYALANGYSVMDALNSASQATGFSNYASTPLGQGYQCYWPYTQYINGQWIYAGLYNGNMHVAGDPYGTQLPANLYYP